MIEILKQYTPAHHTKGIANNFNYYFYKLRPIHTLYFTDDSSSTLAKEFLHDTHSPKIFYCCLLRSSITDNAIFRNFGASVGWN